MSVKKLTIQLEMLSDLKKKRDVLAYRFYNGENQVIILNMILDEIKKMDMVLPEDLYMILSNPEKLATRNIKALCFLLKKVLLVR